MQICHVENEPFYALPFRLGSSASSPVAKLPFLRAFVEQMPGNLDAIVVTSDLQGVVEHRGAMHWLGESLASTVEELQSRGLLPSRDRIAAILAGDLHPCAGLADVRRVWLAMENACCWVAGVAGNHDFLGNAASSAAARAALQGRRAHFLDASTITLSGLGIAGVSGTIDSRPGEWTRDETQYAAVLESLLHDGCDILILHDGPNVAGTDLPGWPSVRRVLEASPPCLVIRGHDHWAHPLACLQNGSQVLNVEGRVVVLQRV